MPLLPPTNEPQPEQYGTEFIPDLDYLGQFSAGVSAQVARLTMTSQQIVKDLRRQLENLNAEMQQADEDHHMAIQVAHQAYEARRQRTIRIAVEVENMLANYVGQAPSEPAWEQIEEQPRATVKRSMFRTLIGGRS